MRIIAFYLPQFHAIPENDRWWGKGFTEWTNVKRAQPLFEGHIQPRLPLNDYFYDLSDNSVMDWQIGLAKKYGVYGFCFYHYWFNGRLLLEKPINDFLRNKTQDFPFCMCWANEHWTNAWVSGKNKVLVEQSYGGKEQWREHFYYLLPFFKDSRYIKEDNMPIFVIYRPELIDQLNEMLDYWNELATVEGLSGIKFAYQHVAFDLQKDRDDSRFTYNIEYQPTYAQTFVLQQRFGALRKIKRSIALFLEKKLKIDIRYLSQHKLTIFDYDEIWKQILKMEPVSKKSLPGAFVFWDNTPRRGNRGIVYKGFSTEKFEKYLSCQIRNAKEKYKTDLLFLFAWNEWAEGGYLEPDAINSFGVLEAIRSALNNNTDLEI